MPIVAPKVSGLRLLMRPAGYTGLLSTGSNFTDLGPMTNDTVACYSVDLIVEALPNIHTPLQVDLTGPYGTTGGLIAQRSGSDKYRFTLTPLGFEEGFHTVTIFPLDNPDDGKLVGSFIVLSNSDPFCIGPTNEPTHPPTNHPTARPHFPTMEPTPDRFVVSLHLWKSAQLGYLQPLQNDAQLCLPPDVDHLSLGIEAVPSMHTPIVFEVQGTGRDFANVTPWVEYSAPYFSFGHAGDYVHAESFFAGVYNITAYPLNDISGRLQVIFSVVNC